VPRAVSKAPALALAVALALALAPVGCGGNGGGTAKPDPQAVRAAVTGFTSAFGSGDGKAGCDLLTSAARAAFVKRVQPLTGTADCAAAIQRVHDAAGAQVTGAYAQAKVGAVKVTGSTATAKLTAGGATTQVKLAKEGGRWKLASVPGI
jgi:hypothetical protein